MNYKKIYDSLVEKAKVRGLDKSKHEGYFEIHHIIPRSVGVSDEPSNMVMFTGREHFIAHMLLYRIYEGNTSLMRAAFLMSSRWSSGRLEESKPIHSKTYEKLRKEYSESVRVQMLTNNPWKGKTHSEKTRARLKEWHANNPNHARKAMAKKAGMTLEEYIKHTAELREKKNKYFVRDKYYLLGWEANNDKYMNQYKLDLESNYYCDDNEYVNGHDTIGNLHRKITTSDEVRIIWCLSQVYKDYWIKSGKRHHKKLQRELQVLSDSTFNSERTLSTMVDMFVDGWEPSEYPKFLCHALNLNKDEREYVDSVAECLKDSLDCVRENFFSDWVKDRSYKREVIKDLAIKLGIELHKNSSKNKLSLVDVIEANILWKSGFVEKKQISALLGVKPNTISQSTSQGLRFKEVTSRIDEIFNTFYGINNE